MGPLDETRSSSRRRWGVFQDPYGVIWSVSNSTETIEDVPKELERKIIPYVMVKDATSYLKFLSEVFEAEIVMPPAKAPDGKVEGGNWSESQA